MNPGFKSYFGYCPRKSGTKRHRRFRWATSDCSITMFNYYVQLLCSITSFNCYVQLLCLITMFNY